MSYTNADGMYVLTHGDKGQVINSGGHVGNTRNVLAVEFPDLSTLTDSTWSPTPIEAALPSGAVILKATVVVMDAATSGGSATLDIGLFQEDGTAIDDDGIDAAIAVASLTANAVVDANGAVVGTRLAEKAYVGATYDTAAFTAGRVKVLIEYVTV